MNEMHRRLVNNESASFKRDLDFIYAGCALLCVIFAATAAGMTTGLLSIDTLKLKIKAQIGTAKEKMYAARILPVLNNHHFLLCTLLIYNAAATEALPIFLDALVPSWAAVAISVTLVLLFGEVIPTALFTGPNQMAIAANFIGLLRIVQVIFYPVAYPMSLLLDYLLGREESSEIYSREEITAMLTIIRSNAMNLKYFEDGPYGTEDGDNDDDGEDPLSNNEVNVITGVLGLAKKCIRDVAIPMKKVNMLSTEQVFDLKTIEAIDQVGHSRLPVFKGTDTTDIIGFFLVKRLINVNPAEAVPLSSMSLKEPLVVGAAQSLLDVLSVFQTGHSHIALVSELPDDLRVSIAFKRPPSPDAAAIGILTIEDIFEAMIQSEIFDEDDREKGQYQEEASMALREMSLRSSLPSMSMSGVPMRKYPGTHHELAAAAAAGPEIVVVSDEQSSPTAASRRDWRSRGGLQNDIAFKRALSEQPGRSALRALSEAAERKPQRLSGNSSGSGGNANRWLAQRATTRSVGSALSGGVHSDGSVHAPLLTQFDLLEDDDRIDAGVGIRKGKLTPSIITKYIKSRARGVRDGSRGDSASRDRALSR